MVLTEQTMKKLESRIGYEFREKKLLKQAMTHSSFSNEQKINRTGHYERLEFLGDAVLELVTSDFLFSRFPDLPEGQLTKKRASMVCEPALAYCAKDISLGDFILLGKGEEAGGGRKRESIISDVLEALIGAIYLDAGLEEAKRFIERFILSDLENKQLFYDSKTFFQELVQKENLGVPVYVLKDEQGPEHDKQFIVEVMLGDQILGRGTGKSKKAAEQKAAYEALIRCR